MTIISYVWVVSIYLSIYLSRMSHVGSLNCSKEEGLQKLNLASETLKFSGTNLLRPAVVVVAEIPLAIHYLFLIKKIIFQHFFHFNSK